jgi:hypothetical protein
MLLLIGELQEFEDPCDRRAPGERGHLHAFCSCLDRCPMTGEPGGDADEGPLFLEDVSELCHDSIGELCREDRGSDGGRAGSAASRPHKPDGDLRVARLWLGRYPRGPRQPVHD